MVEKKNVGKLMLLKVLLSTIKRNQRQHEISVNHVLSLLKGTLTVGKAIALIAFLEYNGTDLQKRFQKNL